MKLHDLTPNLGSKKNRKRVGRGISAGQGKTAGRGTKGAGSRSGQEGHLYHQGGNLPFFRRLPRQPARQKKYPRPEMHPPPLSSPIPTHAPPPRNSWYAEFRVSSTQG